MRSRERPKGASGLRLYEVAVPLADDPGKVRRLLLDRRGSVRQAALESEGCAFTE